VTRAFLQIEAWAQEKIFFRTIFFTKIRTFSGHLLPTYPKAFYAYEVALWFSSLIKVYKSVNKVDLSNSLTATQKTIRIQKY